MSGVFAGSLGALLAAALFFVASHLVISHPALRSAVVGHTGELGFREARVFDLEAAAHEPVDIVHHRLFDVGSAVGVDVQIETLEGNDGVVRLLLTIGDKGQAEVDLERRNGLGAEAQPEGPGFALFHQLDDFQSRLIGDFNHRWTSEVGCQ